MGILLNFYPSKARSITISMLPEPGNDGFLLSLKPLLTPPNGNLTYNFVEVK